MTLDCFHYVRARLESVRRRFDVQLGVQRIKLEDIVVKRAVRGGSRSSVHRSCGRDLKTAVGQLRTLRYAFRQAGRGARNVPQNPVRLIVSGLVAGDIEVVHVEEEALRACRYVGPGHRRRCTLAGGNTWSGLTEPNGNLTAVGKSRYD